MGALPIPDTAGAKFPLQRGREPSPRRLKPMKKQAFSATLVALVIAVAVPAALADSSIGITPANGSDYILPDGTVYQQNDDGTFSWIPDVATANAMGVDGTSLIPVTGLDGPVVQSFPSVLTLSNPSFNRTGAAGGTSPTGRLGRAEHHAGKRQRLRPPRRPGLPGQRRRHLLLDPGRRDGQRDGPQLERADPDRRPERGPLLRRDAVPARRLKRAPRGDAAPPTRLTAPR